jgi:spermidine/putrescine transport system ATP-binding protein
VPAERNHAPGRDLYVGVRPEKLHVAPAGTATPDGHNALEGVIIGSSFTGIGTQSVVRLAGGQEVSAFVQNLSAGPRPAGGDAVVVHWEVEHTFALDGREDATAGDETREEAATTSSAAA